MSIYPKTVREVLLRRIKYRRGTLRAVRAFARSKPWRGTEEERKAKFERLHDTLCQVYDKQTRLAVWSWAYGAHYSEFSDRIVLTKLSVVTYLHEFAHTLYGPDERKVCRWSINLFRRCFPRSYARCQHDRHALRRAE